MVPKDLGGTTVFSKMPKVFGGANGFIITLSLLQQGAKFFHRHRRHCYRRHRRYRYRY